MCGCGRGVGVCRCHLLYMLSESDLGSRSRFSRPSLLVLSMSMYKYVALRLWNEIVSGGWEYGRAWMYWTPARTSGGTDLYRRDTGARVWKIVEALVDRPRRCCFDHDFGESGMALIMNMLDRHSGVNNTEVASELIASAHRHRSESDHHHHHHQPPFLSAHSSHLNFINLPHAFTFGFTHCSICLLAYLSFFLSWVLGVKGSLPTLL